MQKKEEKVKHLKLGSKQAFIPDIFLLSCPVPFLKFIGFILFLYVLTLFGSKECYSQNEDHLVEVSVYWVKETIACAPNGYSSGYTVDAEGKKCAPLSVGQLSKFGQAVAVKVPPKSIPLDFIGDLVDDYRKKCTLKDPCKDPEDRYVLVLAFKFKIKKPKGTIVSLERRIPDSLLNYFSEDKKKGTYYVEHELDQGGHWINHQRADLFLPGYKVQWTLKADGRSWELGTE
jgi:hypothetical protein